MTSNTNRKRRWETPRVEALGLEPEAGLCATSVMDEDSVVTAAGQEVGQNITDWSDNSGFNHVWE